MNNVTFYIQFTLGLCVLYYLLSMTYHGVKDFYVDNVNVVTVLNYRIKSLLYSDEEKRRRLKDAVHVVHALNMKGEIRNRFLHEIKNDISYHNIDDYLFTLPNDNCDYYVISFTKGILFFSKEKSFYAKVEDDDVVISDVDSYPYIMSFVERLMNYINNSS